MRKDVEYWEERMQRLIDPDGSVTPWVLKEMLNFLFDEIEAQKGGAQR